MKQDKIRAIIEGKVKEINKHCEQIDSDFDRDTIHKFRVAVKSLRSFLRLLRMYHEETGLKMPGKFKRLYQVAGAIRDAQLEQEKLAADWAELPVYGEKLGNDIERHKREWHLHYSKQLLAKLKKRLTRFDYEDMPAEALHTFFDKRIGLVHEFTKTRQPTNVQIHNVRKQLKDLSYTAKLAKKEWKAGYGQVQEIPVKEIEAITTEIGNFNDARIKLEHLASFASPMLAQAEKDAIAKICQSDDAKLKAQKKRVMGMVKGFGVAKK